MSGLTDKMFARPPVYVRSVDLPELWRIAARAYRATPQPDLFLEEFHRFRVVQEAADDHFVRLDSEVRYKDLRTKRERLVRLAPPGGADPDRNEVSLLSPIGAALIGLSVNSIFRWSAADGRPRAIKVLEITHGR